MCSTKSFASWCSVCAVRIDHEALQAGLGIQVFRVPQDILDGVVYQDSTEDLENMVEKVEVCELPEHLTGNWLEIRSIATTYQPFVFPSIRYVRNVEYQTTSMTCFKAQQSMSGAIYVTKPSNALSI